MRRPKGMVDRVPRRPQGLATMSARKSAPVSAGGINARRLEQWRVAAEAAERKQDEEDEDYKDGEEEDDDDDEEEEDEGEEEEEKEPNNQCGNPFCKQVLTNRYARFCESKPMCQRYRALKLQCLANAQAEEDEEDTRPLAMVLKKKKKKKDEEEKKKEEDEPFAIPRRKKTENGAGKRRLNLNAAAAPIEERSRSNSSSPREVVRRQKKREMDKKVEKEKEKEKEKEDKRQKKKLKRAREAAESNGAASMPVVTSNSPSVQSSSVSSEEEFVSLADELKKRISPKGPRTRRPPDAGSDSEAGAGTAGVKKRRLSRHISADDVLSRSASASPVSAAPAADTNWKIPRAKPGKTKTRTTAAQAIRRSTSVELVALGVGSQANFPAGGRYVQNGNRTAAPSLRPTDPRVRPPTKFTSPTPPPAAAPPAASSRPPQATQAPRPAPTQLAALPPLPPQAPPVPQQPMQRAQIVTPSASPVRTPATVSSSVSSATKTTIASSATTTGSSRIKRISASDYRKNRMDSEQQTLDQPPSRSSSLERSSSLPDERATAYPVASSSVNYPSRPEYRRSDSAPLSSSSSSSFTLRQREPSGNLDPRRPYPDTEDQFRRQQTYYEGDSGRMEYQDRPAARGEYLDNGYASGSGQWEGRSYPLPRDPYPPRHEEPSSFGTGNGRDGGSFDYAADTHFSPASSPPDPSYRREPQRDELPLPPRVPSPRRSESERLNGDRRASEFDELDEDAPTFSYHESFLPQLLSIFIHKFPPSLDAISNVTKKPRKMNWYIKYVERIERLCEPHDLRVKFEGSKAVVTVRGREWLTLQGSSTVTLHMDVLKSLKAEALTWLTMYEEMEKALKHYRGIYGNQTNESYTFLRAWNDLKRPGSYISLPRQANYFCGARLHHWNFVVGKVEIGSGSHEEKREAFRLATVSALHFLLNAGRGARRSSRPREVKHERSSEATRASDRRQRSSSREPSVSSRGPQRSERAGEASAEVLPTSRPPSSTSSQSARGESPVPAGQPSAANSAASTEPQAAANSTDAQSTTEQLATTNEPQSSAEPSSSPVTVARTEKEPAAAVIPTTDLSSSNEVADAADQSDPGEEMSISDASDLGAMTPTGSPCLPTESPSTVVGSTTTASASPKAATSSSTATGSSTAAPLPLTVSSEMVATAVKLAAVAGVSTAANTPASQTTAKAAVPARRCMMCEMIRMRKPDGERCLRCQQKGAPANGLLGS